MLYSWVAKNTDKDLIYKTRLKLVDKKGFDYRDVSSRLYSYIMAAELGIILN
jgi:hypothetical protein